MANFYKKSHQLGRSMIEMLGVLAIIGVLSVGGIAGYSKAMAKWKLNKAIDEISTIIANVQTLYSNQTTYAGLYENARKLGIFPNDMEPDPDGAKNTYGLLVSLQGYQGGWYLDYYVPSADVCVALVTQDWGISGSLTEILITDNDISHTNFPIPLAEAARDCATGEYGSDGEHIELYFH